MFARPTGSYSCCICQCSGQWSCRTSYSDLATLLDHIDLGSITTEDTNLNIANVKSSTHIGAAAAATMARAKSYYENKWLRE